MNDLKFKRNFNVSELINILIISFIFSSSIRALELQSTVDRSLKVVQELRQELEEDENSFKSDSQKLVIYCNNIKEIDDTLNNIESIQNLVEDINKVVIEINISQQNEIVERLRVNVIYASALINDEEKIKSFKKLGADINLRDKENKTPLIQAAIRQDHNVVILLLRNGANFRLRDSNNKDLFDYIESDYFVSFRNVHITGKQLARKYQNYLIKSGKSNSNILLESENVGLKKDNTTNSKKINCSCGNCCWCAIL